MTSRKEGEVGVSLFVAQVHQAEGKEKRGGEEGRQKITRLP